MSAKIVKIRRSSDREGATRNAIYLIINLPISISKCSYNILYLCNKKEMGKLSKERAQAMGRKSSRKGVKNKTTQEIREAFKLLLDENLEQLRQDLKELEPQQRVKMILELSKFVIPTLKSTELTAEGDTGVGIKPLEIITGMKII
uniref:hypothetical protein n=1 Tax=Ornithobacterium rhinotracheale TaxID=28251 RepID=UPI00129C6F78|nr:hypothetical protein [Ornithobacterium rhinotracheale]